MHFRGDGGQLLMARDTSGTSAARGELRIVKPLSPVGSFVVLGARWPFLPNKTLWHISLPFESSESALPVHIPCIEVSEQRFVRVSSFARHDRLRSLAEMRSFASRTKA